MCPNHSNSHGWQQNHLDSALFLNPKSECTAKGSAVPKVFPLQTCGGLRTGSHDVPCGFASPCETESPKPIAHGKPGLLGGSKKNWNVRSIIRPDGSAEEQVLRLPDGKHYLPRWVEGLLLGSAARNRDRSGVGGLIILYNSHSNSGSFSLPSGKKVVKFETDSNFCTETYLGWEQFMELGGIHDVKLTPLPQGPWDSERESAREVRHKRRLV